MVVITQQQAYDQYLKSGGQGMVAASRYVLQWADIQDPPPTSLIAAGEI